MDITEYLGDIILIIIIVASAWWLFSLLQATWQIITAVLLILLSFAGLLAIVHHKIRLIERNITNREHMIRVNLEEISAKMAQRYDSSVDRITDVVNEVSRRVYR
jgi:membrane protein YdbS with pleckstrin-like domain